MDLNGLLTNMVGQFEAKSTEAHNNSHYFKGAADGLRKFAEEAGKLEQEQVQAAAEEDGSDNIKSGSSKKVQPSKAKTTKK